MQTLMRFCMQKKKHSPFIPKLISGLLLLLFAYVHCFQAFHSHKEASVSTNSAEEQQYQPSTEQCKICNYFAHCRHDALAVTYWLTLSIPLTKAVELNSSVYARIYKFTLQGFSNKGPPILFYIADQSV